MKYRAIVMVPTIVEFENPGSQSHVKNQAIAMVNSYEKVVVGDETFEAKLMGCYPVNAQSDQPRVFDPPPQAA